LDAATGTDETSDWKLTLVPSGSAIVGAAGQGGSVRSAAVFRLIDGIWHWVPAREADRLIRVI